MLEAITNLILMLSPIIAMGLAILFVDGL